MPGPVRATARLKSPGRKAETLVDHIHAVFAREPDARTYRFLEDGEGEPLSMTNAELDRWVRAIAVALRDRVPAGERALIICPPGLDYVASFFACLYAGVIAVPVYPPNPALLKRTLPRLLGVIEDARPAVVLAPAFITALAGQFAEYAPALAGLSWLASGEWLVLCLQRLLRRLDVFVEVDERHMAVLTERLRRSAADGSLCTLMSLSES